jgi:hypothetical protein
MVIGRFGILIVPLLAVGCATQRDSEVRSPAPPRAVAIVEVSPTKLVETRYDVRGYRDAENPAIRHDAHAVYRSTRVSIMTDEQLATIPRETYPMASYSPLPASDELMAEVATQKTITAELRAIQTSMVETERRVQAQYATLIRESAEALKMREQLEAERTRMRVAPTAGMAAAPARAPAGNPPEVKWKASAVM